MKIILVKDLGNRIEEFQQQNIMMFTRIMDKLNGDSSLPKVVCGAIQNRDLPCASLDKFEKFNDLCETEEDVGNMLVILFDNIHQTSLVFTSICIYFSEKSPTFV